MAGRVYFVVALPNLGSNDLHGACLRATDNGTRGQEGLFVFVFICLACEANPTSSLGDRWFGIAKRIPPALWATGGLVSKGAFMLAP